MYRAYAAVFDGHNGASAAEHVADRLHHVLAAEHAMRTCTGALTCAAAARRRSGAPLWLGFSGGSKLAVWRVLLAVGVGASVFALHHCPDFLWQALSIVHSFSLHLRLC